MTNDELIKVSVFSAKYLDEASAKRDDYQAKKSYKDNYTLEDFNAAVIFKKSSKEVDIIVKNEYYTRRQTWLGIIIGFTLSIFTIIFVSI